MWVTDVGAMLYCAMQFCKRLAARVPHLPVGIFSALEKRGEDVKLAVSGRNEAASSARTEIRPDAAKMVAFENRSGAYLST
jgi:hypothetical protein